MKRLPLIVVIIAVLASCATQGVYVGPSKEELKLMDMVKAINKAGGVAVIGTGIDENGREDLALQKAILDGRTQLAQVFETNMQVLEKNFVEEIGAASSAEINQLFSSTVKAITNTTLVGSQSLSNPIIKRSSKVITVKVVVGIDPKTLNTAVMDDFKQKNINLYERYRASEAFKELQKEMDAYEKSNQYVP